jgi:hypothetical protein
MALSTLLLIGLSVAGAGYVVATQKRLPEGQNPFDDFPPGVDRTKRIAVENVGPASSGNSYRSSSYRHADGRLYYVAEKIGSVDWISYFFTPKTGQRQRWHGNASNAADYAVMLADFDMAGQLQGAA